MFSALFFVGCRKASADDAFEGRDRAADGTDRQDGPADGLTEEPMRLSERGSRTGDREIHGTAGDYNTKRYRKYQIRN